MKRKDFKKLKPGDKVRIVSKKTGEYWNSLGLMDKWLGKVMTVRENLGNIVLMKEDIKEFDDGWRWFPYMIDCVVSEPAVTEHLVRGNKTIVKLSNGKVGIARCNPADKFDMYAGAALALARAYGVGPKPAEPKTQQFEIGDRVRLKPYDEVLDHISVYAMTWQKLSAFEGEIVKIEQGSLHRGLIVLVSFPGSGYAPLCFLSSSLIKCPQLSFSFGDLVSVGGSCPRIDLRGDIGVVTNDAEPYNVTMRRTGHSETIEGKYLWRAKK